MAVDASVPFCTPMTQDLHYLPTSPWWPFIQVHRQCPLMQIVLFDTPVSGRHWICNNTHFEYTNAPQESGSVAHNLSATIKSSMQISMAAVQLLILFCLFLFPACVCIVKMPFVRWRPPAAELAYSDLIKILKCNRGWPCCAVLWPWAKGSLQLNYGQRLPLKWLKLLSVPTPWQDSFNALLFPTTPLRTILPSCSCCGWCLPAVRCARLNTDQRRLLATYFLRF